MYISESIKNISENVAKGMGREGATYTAKSYMEIIKPSRAPDRTADDIINDLKRKLEEYE